GRDPHLLATSGARAGADRGDGDPRPHRGELCGHRPVPRRRAGRRHPRQADPAGRLGPHHEPGGVTAVASLTVKSLWANKGRLVGTLLAITLGIAFLSGTRLLGDTL